MSSRRTIRRALVGLALTIAAGTALVLATGPTSRTAHAYTSHHTFISATAALCVETTVQGTVIGTRSGSGPLTRWTNVHLQDPTVSTTGYEVTAGRCDRSHRVRLAATLRQTWSNNGRGADTRQTDEGPATTTLRQSNSGATIRLPDPTFPISIFDADYPVTGTISITARTSTSSESYTYPVDTALTISRH